MVFGYARVSREKQNLDLQLDAFLKEGISEKRIYTDIISRASDEKKSLKKLLEYVREGDTIIVWKLDRIVGSLIQFVKLMNDLDEKGVMFRSLTEPFINTSDSSPQGKLVKNIFASLAEFERSLIIERTKAGLASARARGKVLGAPNGLSEKAKKKAMLAEHYFKEGKLSVSEILDELKISRATYYKYLKYRKVKGIRSYKKK